MSSTQQHNITQSDHQQIKMHSGNHNKIMKTVYMGHLLVRINEICKEDLQLGLAQEIQEVQEAIIVIGKYLD